MDKKIQMIPTEKIFPNIEQPRKLFDAASITELAASICEVGLLSPLLVKKTERGYMIVAGERRFRACKLCGFKEIPCLVCNFDSETVALASIIENVQRKDLDPFEQAEALNSLITTFSLTQAQAAAKVGKSQSAVANKLRLLTLSPELRSEITKSNLTERHARELLRLIDNRRPKALSYITSHNLNVDQTEKYISSLLKEKKPPRKIVALKDIRFFFNTIDKSLKTLKCAGINAKAQKHEDDSFIRFEIIIPKSTS